MRKILIIFLFVPVFAVFAEQVFKHELPAGRKPWTHEKFLNGSRKFSFVVIPDRTGSERPGVFLEAIKKANMLQPDFIITVGDLIQGPTELDKQSPAHLREQWKELESMTAQSEAPFFHVVGNHDISRTRPGFPRANEDSKMVWQEFAGKNTYYHFIYKDVLFLCLNTMEGRDARVPQIGITDTQADWAVKVLKKHADARYVMVFLHQPDQLRSENFIKIENELNKRKYTCFAGDWHHYIKFVRHGRNCYVLATAGGVSDLRGRSYGEFDHITYVTMTEKGPVVANILLDGILPDDAVTPATASRTYRSMLDTAPFKPAKGYPWKALLDIHTLKKHISKDNLVDNIITLKGKSCKEIVPLDLKAPAGKKIRVTAALRATLEKGAVFAVKLREFDANGKLVKSNCIVRKKSCAWGREAQTFILSEKTAKTDICVEAGNFGASSIGETRYIFVEEQR